MDSFVNSVTCQQVSPEQCEQMLQLSRVDSTVSCSNFKKIIGWFKTAHEGSSEDRALASTVANVLLNSSEQRMHASQDRSLIKCVESRLFNNPYDLPRWRIMFLMAHCKPEGREHGHEQQHEQQRDQPFDRLLAPTCFQRMVSELRMDSEYMNTLCELGKFWYALCFNYGCTITNSVLYWNIFTDFAAKPYISVPGFQDCLIQFGSLYLLVHSNEMCVEKTTVNRFLCIFEDKFNDWYTQTTREWYCSLQEHRLPQILNILELLIAYSSPSLKQEIRQCFLSSQNSLHCPFVNSSFIKLIESPINNVSNTTASILSLLHLRHDKSSHSLKLMAPPLASRDSLSSTKSSDYITYSGLPTPSVSSQADPAVSTFSTAASFGSASPVCGQPSNYDDWSEEEQFLEAEKIGAAIERLNELGFVKMSTE